MNGQSNIIAAAIIIAFIVFITMRGELPTYLGFLLGSASAAPVPATVTK